MNSAKHTRDHPIICYTLAGLSLLTALMYAGTLWYRAKNEADLALFGQVNKKKYYSKADTEKPLEPGEEISNIQNIISSGDDSSLETRVQTPEITLLENNVAIANPTPIPVVVQLVWQNPNTNDPTFANDGDETLLARMLYGEVAARSLTEMYAVGHVALTRVQRHIRGNTLREVILAQGQFSAFNNLENPTQPNIMQPIRNSVDRATGGTIPNAYDVRIWNRCLTAARAVLNGTARNPAPNADHYEHVDTSRESVNGRRWLTDGNLEPDWALEYEPVNAGIPAEDTALIQLFNSRGPRRNQ